MKGLVKLWGFWLVEERSRRMEVGAYFGRQRS
jgi:hypothetical protein